jgi:hypothetical protein
MNVEDKILNLKEETKTKIEQALKNNNTDAIVAAAKDLDLIGRLEKQYREIETAIISFAQRGSFDMDKSKKINKSFKQIGKEERENFIREAETRGIILSKEKGQLYRDISNGLVGIAYASECENTPNRWFLGLPNKEYRTIVLICRDEHLKTTYFIFPYTFCTQYQDKFGTDKKDEQIKFNVSVKNGIYTIKVPDSEPIIINEYIDKYDNIAH